MRIVIDIDTSQLSGDIAAAVPGNNGSGVAVTLEPDAGPEASAELLARAEGLNAQNAGPASSRVTLVTRADTPSAAEAPVAEACSSSACGWGATGEGGITNAGPAPG